MWLVNRWLRAEFALLRMIFAQLSSPSTRFILLSASLFQHPLYFVRTIFLRIDSSFSIAPHVPRSSSVQDVVFACNCANAPYTRFVSCKVLLSALAIPQNQDSFVTRSVRYRSTQHSANAQRSLRSALIDQEKALNAARLV